MKSSTNDNSNSPVRFKQIDIDLDGTMKRGGIALSALNIKDVFTGNTSEFIQRKGQKFSRTEVRGALYSIGASEFLIGIAQLGGDLASAPSVGLPLPSLVGTGKTFIVKDEAGGCATTTITVRSAGEKTIDGASTSTITTNYGSKQFYSDGANWYTI